MLISYELPILIVNNIYLPTIDIIDMEQNHYTVWPIFLILYGAYVFWQIKNDGAKKIFA